MQQTHSRTIAYILWLLGFLGAHRFYFGKPLTGALYFCTLGLLGIGWIVDLFLIPGMERQARTRYTTGQNDYSTAWILLTFLGVFGIHRFYLGKPLTGILYLCTVGLAGIGVFYDLITLNAQVNEANYRKNERHL